MISEVFMICDAYESGIGHGLQRDGLINPYDKMSKLHEAYKIGYELGVQRTAQQPEDHLSEEAKNRRANAWLAAIEATPPTS